MKPLEHRIERRTFLRRGAAGLGSLGLSAMLPTRLLAAEGPVPPFPNFMPRARRVIHLCRAGGMSHLEAFDPKPKLAAMQGKPMPPSYTSGQPIAQLQGKKLVCLAPQFGFSRHGQSGLEISDAFPHMGRIADELCIIRSLHTEQINHDPAHTFMNTGTSISGRPSMGAWILHALGSECDDLPGYVVLTSSLAERSPESSRRGPPSRSRTDSTRLKRKPVRPTGRPAAEPAYTRQCVGTLWGI